MVYKPTYNWGAPSCIHFRCLVFSWLFTWRHAPFFRAEIWARPMVIRSMGDLIITWRSGVEELWRGYMMNLACLKKLSMLNLKKNTCINIYICCRYKSSYVYHTHMIKILCIYIYIITRYITIYHIYIPRVQAGSLDAANLQGGASQLMEDIWLCLDIGHTPTLRLWYFLRNFDEKTSYRLWYNSYNN